MQEMIQHGKIKRGEAAAVTWLRSMPNPSSQILAGTVSKKEQGPGRVSERGEQEQQAEGGRDTRRLRKVSPGRKETAGRTENTGRR